MSTANHVERARQDGVLLGVPLGDLGWLQSTIMGFATGFAAFFLSTFLSILGLLVYAAVSHRTPDYAIAYKFIGLPVGLVVLVMALGFLAVQYARQVRRKAARRQASAL